MELRHATQLRWNPQLIIRALILLAFVGAAAFAVAFHQNPVMHETFHDMRHAAGFPCH